MSLEAVVVAWIILSRYSGGMPSALDISGKVFGRLTAVEPTEVRSGGKIVWRCLCECGESCLAAVNHLQDGRRVSCGCAKAAGTQLKVKAPRHGHYAAGRASPTYYSWTSMRTRCLNPNASDFHRYGGRGVTICAEWESFESFLADMGARPAGTTLERKDVNGPYSPENCVWATDHEQLRNKRTNRVLSAFGRSQILSDWSREYGIPKRTITDRLARGLTPEEALLASGTKRARLASSDGAGQR